MPTRFRSALTQDHKDWLDGAANSLLRVTDREGGCYIDLQTLVRHNGVLVCLVYEVGDDVAKPAPAPKPDPAPTPRRPLHRPKFRSGNPTGVRRTDKATQEAMRAAYASGTSVAEIARTYGVNRTTVQHHVRKDA